MGRKKRIKERSKYVDEQIQLSQQQLEAKVVGLDKEIKALENILLEFAKNRNGGSCVLSGKRGCGKSHVLKHIVEKHKLKSQLNYEEINGYFYTTQGVSSKLFEELNFDEKENTPTLFVIDHFEQFTQKQSQPLLYSILNGCQENPWFALLIGTTENSINLLEKRIKSRVSKVRINLSIPISVETFREKFTELLHDTVSDSIVRQITSSPMFETFLNEFFSRTTQSGFCFAKRLAMLFRIVYPIQNKAKSLFEILQFCAESISTTNDMIQILQSISLRQLCLLNCLFMLEQGAHAIRRECNYGDIIIGYKKLVNDYDSSMQVENFALFKDLDELVSLGLIVFKGGTDLGQLEFRKVYSNIDREIVIKTVQARDVPVNIQKWFFPE